MSLTNDESPRAAIRSVIGLLKSQRRTPVTPLEKRSLKIKAQNEILDNLIERIEKML